MGHLKDITNQPKLQSFPGATFQIQGQVPAAQCSEARIEGDAAFTEGGGFDTLNDPFAFVGWDLIGKVCTIIDNPGGNTGDFDISANTDHHLGFDDNPGFGKPTTYYVHDGGALILTRDLPSFIRYIQAYSEPLEYFTGQTTQGLTTLTDAGKFTVDLAGTRLLYIDPDDLDFGNHNIISNTLNVLTTDHTFFGNSANVQYRIYPPQPYATTVKGGKLYTNIPSAKLQPACSILFDPLT